MIRKFGGREKAMVAMEAHAGLPARLFGQTEKYFWGLFDPFREHVVFAVLLLVSAAAMAGAYVAILLPRTTVQTERIDYGFIRGVVNGRAVIAPLNDSDATVRGELVLPAADANAVRVGRRVSAKLDTNSNQLLWGQVTDTTPVAGEPKVRVGVELRNRRAQVQTAAFATLRIDTSIVHDGLRIPTPALAETTNDERQRGLEAVFILNARGDRERITFTPGVRNEKYVEARDTKLRPRNRVILSH